MIYYQTNGKKMLIIILLPYKNLDSKHLLSQTLHKHVCAIYCNISRLLNGYFQMKKCDNFLIFAKNIDRG